MVSTDQTVIQTVGVWKTFRDFWHRAKVTAVQELDMEVRRNEVFGLLGPNGSGKSTTIKMILGLLYPSRGYIRVFDHRPTDVAIKARIGFLPEESHLYPFLSARETLDYYGRLFRQPRVERNKRIDMLLDMVGLSAVASRRVGEYSKGMQRRIGLAQALINDPELLILDEPTSGLDPLGTRQFKDLIRELASRGKTVLLSSHLLADVEDVCDRVTILYGGRKRAEGGVADLLSQHELTQITCQRLDEATVSAIRRLVEQHASSLLEVSTPRDRLETLFLRIVEQAQAERLTTGGAVAGQLAEFLRAEPAEGRAVLEHLVQSVEDQPQAQPAEPAFAREQAESRQVLEELTDRADQPAREPASDATEKPQPAAQADREVLDSLLDNNDTGKK